MKEERLGSPNDFATRLASRLADLTERGSPLPTDADLTALVEAMFFASQRVLREVITRCWKHMQAKYG